MRLLVLIGVLVAMAVATAPSALADDARPTRADIEDELWCYDCEARLDYANSRLARIWIEFIDERIAAGDSKSEIKAKLVAQYGTRILYRSAPAAQESRLLTDLKDEVMCPVCPGETLEQSNSPAAQQVEKFIASRIAAGDTKSQIKDRLVAEYGPQILAAPPKRGFDLLAWVLPLAGAFLGALALGFAAWRWSRRREGQPPAPAEDPALERRLDLELARFE